jgi:hypothetical protein
MYGRPVPTDEQVLAAVAVLEARHEFATYPALYEHLRATMSGLRCDLGKPVRRLVRAGRLARATGAGLVRFTLADRSHEAG